MSEELTEPRKTGFVKVATTIFESLGVLNKGSADAPAMPSPEQAAKTTGISTNTLNATRVSGLAAVIASVGAAALAIFNVNKATDKPSVVVAAYISVGAIIASALLTVAIIVSADIRSRVSANTAALQAATATGATLFVETWRHAVEDLKNVLARLQRHPDDVYDAWLDASASSGPTGQLKPTPDQQSLHARLLAGQSRILSELENLIPEADGTKRGRILAEIQRLIDSMERSLQG
jgi:hypothetical protein